MQGACLRPLRLPGGLAGFSPLLADAVCSRLCTAYQEGMFE